MVSVAAAQESPHAPEALLLPRVTATTDLAPARNPRANVREVRTAGPPPRSLPIRYRALLL